MPDAIPIDGATPITVTLTALQWSVVRTALWKAPLSAEVVLPLIQTLDELLRQAVPQLNGSAAEPAEDVQHVQN